MFRYDDDDDGSSSTARIIAILDDAASLKMSATSSSCESHQGIGTAQTRHHDRLPLALPRYNPEPPPAGRGEHFDRGHVRRTAAHDPS